MTVSMSEHTFLEHLAFRFNISAPEFLSAEAHAQEIKNALNRWGGKALVKPDVLTGKSPPGARRPPLKKSFPSPGPKNP